MLIDTKKILLGAALAGLAACAQQQQEAPVGIQPTFDKFGTAMCPPGYVLAGDVCLLPAEAEALGYVVVSGDGDNGGAAAGGDMPGTPDMPDVPDVPDIPDVPDVPDTPGQEGNMNQNQIQQQNMNQNQQQNTNQTQSGPGS